MLTPSRRGGGQGALRCYCSVWMPAPIRTLEPRHLTQKCVGCGLTIRDPERDGCPRCGVDFDERPPMSYAEMEGLLDADEHPVVLRRPAWQERQLVERWLLVAFIAAVGIIVTIGLMIASSRG